VGDDISRKFPSVYRVSIASSREILQMKRRSVLSLLPAASVLLAFRAGGAPVVASAISKAPFRIAIQCWSFRQFTLFEAIQMAAAAGADSVELFPGQTIGGPHGDAKLTPEIDDATLQSLIDHLAKNQVDAINFGVTNVPNDEAKARPIFEFAKKLGLHGISTEALGSIDLLEKLAVEYDIKVCFHNHPKPSALWNPDIISEAIKGRHANLGFCADIGHWAASGLDPLEVIRKIAPRVHAFHMKDRASIEKRTSDLPFGAGVIRIPGILDAVRAEGFAGNVSIEYERNWKNNLPEVAQCVGYLRAYSKMRA